ncbi:MAG: hypothetical protein ACE5HE_12500 [Phycisphaerae bacterium]
MIVKPWDEMTLAEKSAELSLPKKVRRWFNECRDGLLSEAELAARREECLRRGLGRYVAATLRRPPPKGRLVKSRRGTWGRILTAGCRKGYVTPISHVECIDRGLKPGPGNV